MLRLYLLCCLLFQANTRRKPKTKSRCSVRVCVRVRPLCPHEAKDTVILHIKDERVVTLIDPKHANDPNKPLSRSRGEGDYIPCS